MGEKRRAGEERREERRRREEEKAGTDREGGREAQGREEEAFNIKPEKHLHPRRLTALSLNMQIKWHVGGGPPIPWAPGHLWVT